MPDRIRAQADELYEIADRWEFEPPSTSRVETLTTEVEDNCVTTRAIVRGR